MDTKLGWSLHGEKAFFGGALILLKMDGNDFFNPINSDAVKKYYARKKEKKEKSKSKIQKDGLGLKKWLLELKTYKRQFN